MFYRRSLPVIQPWLPWLGGTRSGPGVLLRVGVAFAMAVSTAMLSSGVTSAAGPLADGTSIQYQEAISHASGHYQFTPGTGATVPFRPRPGEATLVDGTAPIALPAGQGSGVAPQLAPETTATPNSAANVLSRQVFGFLPYWELSTALNYDTLSTVAFFGTTLNDDGSLTKSGYGWSGWVSSTMDQVINDAHAHGTRVALTIEAFAWDQPGIASQTALLSSPKVSQAAAQAIAAEVRRRGVDGVNLDFEPIAVGEKADFTAFTRLLRSELDKVQPGYELTFDTTGAAGSYDLPGLLAPGAADAVFIMGYDFRTGSSATTGSTDPLTSPNAHNPYTLTSVVNTFKSQVPASKIILGLPWYGMAWSTGTANGVNAPPAADISTYGAPVTGVTYATAKALADQDPATTKCDPGFPNPCVIGWQYDAAEQSAWTAYYGGPGVYGGTSGTWREVYFDNPQSLGAKIDAIDGWNLRGVGIWALGYDGADANGDLMRVVASKLTLTTYHALAPARILDTRDGTGGLSGPFAVNVARTFQVTGHGGVPANAAAVTGNLTVTGQTGAGLLYIGPIATNSPTSSTLNFPIGDNRANGVTAALGSGGTLSITFAGPTAGTTAHAVFDVTGYFTPDTSGATYHALSPNRILDTRDGTGGLSGPFTVNSPRTFQVTGHGGVLAGATAVTGNLTVTGQTGPGLLYIGPIPLSNPGASTLNFPVGDNRANGVTVQLGPGGTLSITLVGPSPVLKAQVVFDVTGYFTLGTSGATYHALVPTRILDSRDNTGGLSGPFTVNASRSFQVTGNGPVAANAVAVTGNLTVTGQTSPGFLYIGPIPSNNPGVSTLNFPVNDNRANGVTVALGSAGTLSVTCVGADPSIRAQAVFDVTGYFTY